MTVAVRLARYAPVYAAARAAGLDFFSDSERIRYESFAAAARREQFTAARWLLRCLLAELHGIAPSSWALSAEAGVAPRILSPGEPPLHVSLSHSGEWVACAVAGVPVGLDLETTSRPRKVAPLAQQCCTSDEQRELAVMEPAAQLQAFYRMWTLKEAWLKQRSLGLDFSLMRGLVARPAGGDLPATALSLFDEKAGLRLAVTMDIVVQPLPVQAEGLSFTTERWHLRQLAS